MIEFKIIEGKNYIIIEVVLTYIPEYCTYCGYINEYNNDTIKCDFKKIVIILLFHKLILLIKTRYFQKY